MAPCKQMQQELQKNCCFDINFGLFELIRSQKEHVFSMFLILPIFRKASNSSLCIFLINNQLKQP
jgi:hypothetical protein